MHSKTPTESSVLPDTPSADIPSVTKPGAIPQVTDIRDVRDGTDKARDAILDAPNATLEDDAGDIQKSRSILLLQDRLKQETVDSHHEVDRAMALLRPTLSLDDYKCVLRVLAEVIPSLELHVLGRNVCGTLSERIELSHRKKSDWILRDLDDLGVAHPPLAELANLNLFRPFAGLGIVYVLEASTLGGGFIAEHVETTLKTSATRYFRSYGEARLLRWREFCDALNVTDAHSRQADAAVAAARASYALLRDHLSYGVPKT